MTSTKHGSPTRPSPLQPDLARVAKEIAMSVKRSAGTPRQRTLAMFDMAESTKQKLIQGQRQAIAHIVSHNLLCRRLTEAYGGRVIKEVGDGVLCLFDEPVAACQSGLNIKAAFRHMNGVETKGAITTGAVEELEIGGVSDALGEPVDRCARVLGLALTGQVLIDQATRDSAQAWLADYEGIVLDGPFEVDLKGCGPTRLFELSLEGELTGDLRVPFRIDPTGRLPVTEKDRFLQAARERIIELGIGLTTFTGYLRGTRPAERKFAEDIIGALEQGVNVACYALNPRSTIARQYVRDRGEPEYLKEITRALNELVGWGKAHASGLRGNFEVRVYDHFPYMHAMCIDPQSDGARIIVSHYLYATRRADTPYLQLGRQENPALFQKWWSSVEALAAGASPWSERR